MRGEHDELVGFGRRRAHSLGERVEQQRMCVKRLDGFECHSGRKGSSRGVDVLLHAERRKLRRERNANHPRHAGPSEPGERVVDQRRPVAHADRNRNLATETRLQRIGLRLREVGQRRPASDRLVVVPHLGDEFIGRRTAAANELQVLRHLVHRGGSAVRH